MAYWGTTQRRPPYLALLGDLVRPLLAVEPTVFVPTLGIGLPAALSRSRHRCLPSVCTVSVCTVIATLCRVGFAAWHPGVMAKEIDRQRASGALAVLKQHPGMVLFALSPALLALALVWWLLGAGWAAVLLIAGIIGGGSAVLLKRR